MDKETNTFNIIKALHSESKIRILIDITQKKSTNVTSIVDHTKISRTNVSNHLSEMVELNILTVEQEGRKRFYQFNENMRKENKAMINEIINAYLTCPCLCECGKRKKGC